MIQMHSPFIAPIAQFLLLHTRICVVEASTASMALCTIRRSLV